MSAKVTHLFERRRAPRWQPAPDRTSIPLPQLSIQEQLGLLTPAPHRPGPDPDAHSQGEDTEVLPAVYAPGPATASANQRQRLRHANELLRTFTKSA